MVSDVSRCAKREVSNLCALLKRRDRRECKKNGQGVLLTGEIPIRLLSDTKKADGEKGRILILEFRVEYF
ncbi:hypothetical protein UWK_01279 [Desulfocapsa sulfexigens DSM 10523]|uniref:Uncharacterized protein n=1 Tax=Desulfocapsa sulfexigens (strain DSM 10523 / SB164P1) TaxID=1167006 RepID=M1P837_DESSD|nr:hypothetical protein UWK_01279 [Desulfocapsa sulfexigens DSM 10523]